MGRTKEADEFKIAIDPGVSKGYGYAVFKAGLLIKAGIAGTVFKLPTEGVIEGVIEIPVIRRSTPRAKDITDLSISVGIVEGVHNKVKWRRIPPEAWKGQLPKSISKERILARLHPFEIAIIQNRKRDDVWDAIGVGLFAFTDRSLVKKGEPVKL